MLAACERVASAPAIAPVDRDVDREDDRPWFERESDEPGGLPDIRCPESTISVIGFALAGWLPQNEGGMQIGYDPNWLVWMIRELTTTPGLFRGQCRWTIHWVW